MTSQTRLRRPKKQKLRFDGAHELKKCVKNDTHYIKNYQEKYIKFMFFLCATPI